MGQSHLTRPQVAVYVPLAVPIPIAKTRGRAKPAPLVQVRAAPQEEQELLETIQRDLRFSEAPWTGARRKL